MEISKRTLKLFAAVKQYAINFNTQENMRTKINYFTNIFLILSKTQNFKTRNETRIDVRSSHRRCSVRKDVFINLAKFTAKHLC